MNYRNLYMRIKFKFFFEKAKYFSKNVLINFDSNWFKDKRVAIVGGADSVLKEKLGEYIDGFDIVVRINKGVEIIESQYEYAGKKTDVLFHSFCEAPSHLGGTPITPELWKVHNVKKILYARTYRLGRNNCLDFLTFLNNSKRKIKFSQLPDDLYLKNLAAVQPNGNEATVGFSAINTVISCQPKELYITGITFFKTPHNTAYRSISEEVMDNAMKVEKHHDVDAEYQYVKKLYIQHQDIIKPDSTLKEIFKNN